MKRILLALGISAAALAISTPALAQTGCRWYDVNCRIATGDVRTGGTVDGSWQLVGHDANGNAIYQRRRVDGNGNVVIERARRDALGRMVIIDRDIDNRSNRNVVNSRRYEKNGMICKYKENSQGYKEQCKYVKNNAGKLYRVNDIYRDGVYRDGIYRDGIYRDGIYRDGIYRDDDYRTNRIYRTNKVNGSKYKSAKVNSNKYIKANSAKYNKPGKGNNPGKGNKH